MSREIKYKDLVRHGDTILDRQTNCKVLLLHVKFLGGVEARAGIGFIGYAKNGLIYIITNMSVGMIHERFSDGARIVLTEKHRPFYAGSDNWYEFSRNRGTFGFFYEIGKNAYTVTNE